MNTVLLSKAKKQVLVERPKLAGYPNLSRSDLEVVVWCVESGNALNYASSSAEKLYNDICQQCF